MGRVFRFWDGRAQSAYPPSMETRTHDELLALHHSRLVGWLVIAVGRALVVGAVVALVAGRLTGWPVVGAALGVIAAGVALMLSGAPIPPDPDAP